MIRNVLRGLGYEIQRARRSVNCIDTIAARTVKESQYYKKWSTPCPVFTPWIGHPHFENLFEGVAPYTIVSRERCYILVCLARYARELKGDFAECGVYRGGTALLLARVLRDADKILYLFDSFKGLPKENNNHDNYYREGDFALDSVESVKSLFMDCGPSIDIRAGWIPATFLGLENNRYAFVHIDVDLYQSALDCCSYFYSRMEAGGVMVFDDYGFPACRGEKDAVDEFFADKPESPMSLPTGQAIVLKLPSTRCV